jgi:uncharacterized protein (TIGR02246 family)
MPLIYLILLAVTVAITPAIAASPEDEIRVVLDAQVAAWNRGDIEAFMSGYENSPKTSFVSDRVLKGYDTVLERYQRTYGAEGAMGTLEFSNLDFRVLSPQNALVIGSFHLTRDAAGGGEARGIFSILWAHVDGNWKIIHDHTTALDEQ